jgi:hypothetical protein
MNRKFTELTTVLMMTALCALPLAGQEKVAVKMESALHESVQLRADDAEALPDSAIHYAPDGERKSKYVYTGENQGRYTWENNAWRFISASTVGYTYFSLSKYAWEYFEIRPVSYEIEEETVYLYIPMINAYHEYHTFDLTRRDFGTEYDANGNLISFKVLAGKDVDRVYTISYNTDNRPVSIEGRRLIPDNLLIYKVRYEYDAYGSATLFESYNLTGVEWEELYRETAEYDAQGKIIYKEHFNGNQRDHKFSYEYYDEHHFSSISCDVYSGGNSWKHEFKYGADGKLGAMYDYTNDELSYYMIFYPNTLDNPGNANEPVDDMRIWSYGGNLHVRTAQPAVLHIYTPTGALHTQQTLPAGETTFLLPPGMYIVKVGDRTAKVVIGK